MARLTYLILMSLDGYVADKQGKFDWAEPDEEVHSFVNELARSVGTHLYGRRMYETMAVRETLDADGQPGFMRDFARIWQAADKIVYSRTLKTFPPLALGLNNLRAQRRREIEGRRAPRPGGQWPHVGRGGFQRRPR